ncbi:mechanosensitive ion channel domain-containing protein [Peptostreptococcaceae bacterium AGR-M142]
MDFIEYIRLYLATHMMSIFEGVAIFLIGYYVARVIKKSVRAILEKSNFNRSMVGFISQLVYFFALVFVVAATLSKFGVNSTSMVAAIGAAGFAIALALQSSLSNFASGIIIIVLKPFHVGDFIEGAGVKGLVEEIQIFNTTLKTPNNEVIIVPNSNLTSSNIKNYSNTDKRRVDVNVGISYDANFNEVKSLLMSFITNHEKVLKTEEANVFITGFGNSSIDISIRVWTKASDYWTVYFHLTEKIKEEFDKNGVEIPFPQRVVHLKNEN